MIPSTTSAFQCLLVCFNLLALNLVYANESQSIEKISVINSVRINTLDDVFTANNTLIFPEQTLSLNRSVADVIAQTEGVELNGQGGLLQSYNIRGFSRDRIKTRVNGIPIITDRRAGNSVSFIPIELMNSVFIQKGASSSLYGSGAMGGVVNISTVGDAHLTAMNIQPRSQLISTQYTDGNLNIGGVYRQANNTESPNHSKLNNQYQQSALTISTEKYWHNIQLNASSVISYGKDIGKSSITFPLIRESSYPEDKHVLSQINFSDTRSWTVQFFQHMQRWQSEVMRIENGEISRRNLTHYSSDTYGLTASYVVQQTKFGIDWHTRQNINISEQEFTFDETLQWESALVNANEKNIGGYINQAWSFNKLTFTLGGRLDYVSLSSEKNNSAFEAVNKTSKTAFSASMTADYKLNQNTKVKAEVGSSFRFPTVSELLFSGETPRGATVGNTNLRSEDSLGYQFSISHYLSPSFYFNFNTYFYTIDHYIERVVLSNGTRSFKNTDRVHIKGAEFKTEWQANTQFNTSLALQWQTGKNALSQTVDDGLPAAIKWAFQWTPVYKNLSRFSMVNSMNYRLSKNKVGPSESHLSNVLIWNMGFNFELSQRVIVNGSINNMLDKNYKASADEDAPFQPDRAVSLQLKWFY